VAVEVEWDAGYVEITVKPHATRAEIDRALTEATRGR